MTAVHRWFVVALGVVAVVAAPLVVAAWPVDDPDLSTAELLDRVRAADDQAYSGYVESVGGLALPVTDEFTDVADLVGGTNRLRVWWRESEDWRVDRLEPAGEVDLHSGGTLTTTWDYEALRATRTAEVWAFLPRSVDVLPPVLAQRLLDGATADELSRLPAERIAGRVAPGLRLTPSAPQANVDHVDVWADEETGLPLRVTGRRDQHLLRRRVDRGAHCGHHRLRPAPRRRRAARGTEGGGRPPLGRHRPAGPAGRPDR